MTDIQLTPGDRLRLEILLKSLAEGGTHLAVLSEHDLVLDYLANLIDERLRAQSDCTVEFCFSTNAERLVQKFNDILSELTLDQALDKDRRHAPRRYLVFRDSILVQDSELLLLARLVNGFPASNISVILLVNSVGSHRHKLEAFGKSLVQWSVETRAGQPRQLIESLVADAPNDPPSNPPVVNEVVDPASLAAPSAAPSWRIPDVGATRAEPMAAPDLRAEPAIDPSADATLMPASPPRRRFSAGWLLVPLLSVLVFAGLYRDVVEQEYQALRQYLLRGTPAPAATPVPAAAPAEPEAPAPTGGDKEEEVLPSPRAAAAMEPHPEPAPAGNPSPAAAPATAVTPATPAPPAPAPSTPAAAAPAVPAAKPVTASPATPTSPVPTASAPAAAPVARAPEAAPAPQVSAAADDWLEQLAAGGFVVQLAAFDTEAEILNFQRSDAVYAKARVVRVHRKDSNKRYYVLIAGPMATKAQAEAYMQSHRLLAKGWLRTAKSLKAQL